MSETTHIEISKAEDDVWKAIGAEGQLSNAINKLSIHELRLIIKIISNMQREKDARIAEEYSAMAHATYDIKNDNFPQKSPVHIFIASEIRGA